MKILPSKDMIVPMMIVAIATLIVVKYIPVVNTLTAPKAAA